MRGTLHYDPSSGLDQSAWQASLSDYLTSHFPDKSDLIISDDMTSCEDLLLLKSHLADVSYRAYLVEIANYGEAGKVIASRKLGLLWGRFWLRCWCQRL